MNVFGVLANDMNALIGKNVRYNISGNINIEFLVKKVKSNVVEYLNENGEPDAYKQYLISDGSCGFYPIHKHNCEILD